ncbi:MAG: hypothetical protein IPL35_05230 [Sphingobacteriales bacterium]|nr:hypothetical protein [Sphingobacteriales bacterium]
MKNTLFDYAQENSNWHFDPSKKSNDFYFVGNKVFIPQKELHELVNQLEESNLLKEIILGKRMKKYDNNSVYQNDELTLWGYNESQSFMKSIDVDGNKFLIPSYIQETIDSLGIKNAAAALMIQYPGQMLPWHCDLYLSYRDKTNMKLSENIVRYLVALSEWDWGHYFLCGNSVWHQWKAGDIITWDYLMYHCSSNSGRRPKITMSITGIK